MNVCKKRASGNLIISKSNKEGSYYCFDDINIAKSQFEYEKNKIEQQSQSQQLIRRNR